MLKRNNAKTLSPEKVIKKKKRIYYFCLHIKWTISYRNKKDFHRFYKYIRKLYKTDFDKNFKNNFKKYKKSSKYN